MPQPESRPARRQREREEQKKLERSGSSSNSNFRVLIASLIAIFIGLIGAYLIWYYTQPVVTNDDIMRAVTLHSSPLERDGKTLQAIEAPVVLSNVSLTDRNGRYYQFIFEPDSTGGVGITFVGAEDLHLNEDKVTIDREDGSVLLSMEKTDKKGFMRLVADVTDPFIWQPSQVEVR